MRIAFAHAIDFLALARRQILVGIKTPAAFEQTLSPQNLMNSGDAPAKLIPWVKNCGICVCDLLGERKQIRGNLLRGALRQREMANGSLRPHRPMTQQSANDSDGLSAEVKL